MSKWVALNVSDGDGRIRTFEVDREWLIQHLKGHDQTLEDFLGEYTSEDSLEIESLAILYDKLPEFTVLGVTRNMMYEKLMAHVGHDIVCVTYGDNDNVAIECEDCNEVLVDVDKEDD